MEQKTTVKRTNKVQQVLNHLKAHGQITSMHAINLYSATRLAAIIFVLRERGHNIETKMVKKLDINGWPCQYALYLYSNK